MNILTIGTHRAVVTYDPELHARAVEVAAAEGISLNQLIERAIEHEVGT
ncbi:MAG: toxin-antitoxin system HicB family antitoxin [Burkholderia gladioli]